MGDIVDWMFTSGQLDMPDPFDHGNDDYPRNELRCKYCGSTHVKWGNVGGKWRLYTKGLLHKCPSMPPLKEG